MTPRSQSNRRRRFRQIEVQAECCRRQRHLSNVELVRHNEYYDRRALDPMTKWLLNCFRDEQGNQHLFNLDGIDARNALAALLFARGRASIGIPMSSGVSLYRLEFRPTRDEIEPSWLTIYVPESEQRFFGDPNGEIQDLGRGLYAQFKIRLVIAVYEAPEQYVRISWIDTGKYRVSLIAHGAEDRSTNLQFMGGTQDAYLYAKSIVDRTPGDIKIIWE